MYIRIKTAILLFVPKLSRTRKIIPAKKTLPWAHSYFAIDGWYIGFSTVRKYQQKIEKRT